MFTMPLNPNAKPFVRFPCPKPLNPNAKPFGSNHRPVQIYVCKPCWQWRPILPTATLVNLNSDDVATVEFENAKRVFRVSNRRNNLNVPVSSGKHYVASGSPGIRERKPKSQEQRIDTSLDVKKSSAKGRTVIPFPPCSFENQKQGFTTVMIKNIPNQFRKSTLVSVLRQHCRKENRESEHRSEFDFVYLPMDFQQYWKNKRVANLGYAFVNFTSYVAALRFYESFHNREWKVKINNKICEVTLAKIQGKEALVRQFKNSVFWCHTDNYLPVVVEPPCDGEVFPKDTCVGRRVCAPSTRPRTKQVMRK